MVTNYCYLIFQHFSILGLNSTYLYPVNKLDSLSFLGDFDLIFWTFFILVLPDFGLQFPVEFWLVVFALYYFVLFGGKKYQKPLPHIFAGHILMTH